MTTLSIPMFASDIPIADSIFGAWSNVDTVNSYMAGAKKYDEEPGLKPFAITLSRGVFLGWNSSVLIDPFSKTPYINLSGRVLLIKEIRSNEKGEIEIVLYGDVYKEKLLVIIVKLIHDDEMELLVGDEKFRLKKMHVLK